MANFQKLNQNKPVNGVNIQNNINICTNFNNINNINNINNVNNVNNINKNEINETNNRVEVTTHDKNTKNIRKTKLKTKQICHTHTISRVPCLVYFD
jgi:hypothetical protein